MKRFLKPVVVLASLVVFAVYMVQSQQTTTNAAPQKKTTTEVDKGHAGYIFQHFDWVDAPPSLPKGAQMAVLQGSPNKAGPFTMRLKLPAGYRVQPHWHASDEGITVISGLLNIGMAPEYGTTAKSSKAIAAGSFALLPAKMRHSAWTDVETVIQISGIGPWQVHYVYDDAP